MIIFPNAKINIGLQILRKRPDNYHDLETVFYPLRVYDVLEIIEASERRLFISGINIPDSEENLCNKVYKLMQTDFNLPALHIYLHKAIPVGAGLGGGSSDASFLIKLVNDYFNLKLNVEQMINYARKIGADCAFFIENNPVFASGIGDQFSALEVDLSAYSIVLVKPDIHINTAEAFSEISPNENGRDLQRCILQPIHTWKTSVFNDFEPAVFDRYPKIGEIKQALYNAGALYSSMSGTGSSIFGIFERPVQLPELAKSNQVIYC